MIVINVIRRAMNLHPWHRLAGRPTSRTGCELRVLLLHLGVAVHADLGVGNVGVLPRPRPRCGNNGNPFPVASRADRAERAPAGSACIRRACISAWRNTRSRRSGANHDGAADHKLEWQPVGPVSEKIRHNESAETKPAEKRPPSGSTRELEKLKVTASENKKNFE